MNNSLDDRIEDYLNGVLSDEDTKRFEEELLKEDVATEFREVLFMKELLRDIPPPEPPPGLDHINVVVPNRHYPTILLLNIALSKQLYMQLCSNVKTYEQKYQ